MLYDTAKFKRPTETKPFINPSKERIFKLELSTQTEELNFSINVDRQIFLLNVISPTSLIDKLMLEKNVTNFSTINKEELIARVAKNSLKIN